MVNCLIMNTNILNFFQFPNIYYDLFILKQGLNILNSGCGMQSEDKQKRGEALPLGKSMKLETPYPLGSE